LDRPGSTAAGGLFRRVNSRQWIGRVSALGSRESKPRIFLGSSGKQELLLEALTRGLEDVVQVEPWTTSFNPGTTTLERTPIRRSTYVRPGSTCTPILLTSAFWTESTMGGAGS
jgi:hypothetical protein